MSAPTCPAWCHVDQTDRDPVDGSVSVTHRGLMAVAGEATLTMVQLDVDGVPQVVELELRRGREVVPLAVGDLEEVARQLAAAAGALGASTCGCFHPNGVTELGCACTCHAMTRSSRL